MDAGRADADGLVGDCRWTTTDREGEDVATTESTNLNDAGRLNHDDATMAALSKTKSIIVR
jgi:hypothetical protein